MSELPTKPCAGSRLMELRQLEYVPSPSSTRVRSPAGGRRRRRPPSRRCRRASGGSRTELGRAALRPDRAGARRRPTDAGPGFRGTGPADDPGAERSAFRRGGGRGGASFDTGHASISWALPTLARRFRFAAFVGRFRVLQPGRHRSGCRSPRTRGALADRGGRGPQRGRARGSFPARPRRSRLDHNSRRQEIVAVCPPGTQLPAPGRLPVGRLAGMPLVATPARNVDARPPRPARSRAAGGRAPDRRGDLRSERAIRAVWCSSGAGNVVPAVVDGGDPSAARGAVVARLVPALTTHESASCIARIRSARPPRAFVELAARQAVALGRRVGLRPAARPAAARRVVARFARWLSTGDVDAPGRRATARLSGRPGADGGRRCRNHGRSRDRGRSDGRSRRRPRARRAGARFRAAMGRRRLSRAPRHVCVQSTTPDTPP